MAGQGPAPSETRRRRNEPQRGEWVDLAPLEAPVLPELPEGEWAPHTEMMWAAWRSDPVTSQYSEADIAFAVNTIVLMNNPKAQPAELRLRMDALGLTPKGKRDLRWRIPGQAVAEPPKKRRASSSGGSRRARLSVVES